MVGFIPPILSEGETISKPDAPQPPDYTSAARVQGQQNLEAIRTGATLNRVNQSSPLGSTSYRDLGGDRWEQTTTLSPDQQAILDAAERNQIDLSRIAGSRLGQIEGEGALDLSGLPGRITSTPTSQFNTSINAPSVGQSAVNLADLGNLPTDYSAERQRAEEALYGRSTRYLDPQFAQEEEATRTRLINSGNAEGSEGWTNAMSDLARRKEAAYANAREGAIIGGGEESSRLLADALRGRQQTVSERFGTGTFANQAAQQQFANEAARTGLVNELESQRFGQRQANAALTNAGREAGLSELLTERGVPLQEFMSLYGGGAAGPGSQQPGGIPQAGTPAPGDYQGAVNQQYAGQLDQYNAQAQRSAQQTSSLINLAAIAAMYFSDRRLKRDIEPAGTMGNGVPLYTFRYLWSDQRYLGAMADEAEQIMPEAVVQFGPFRAIDYGVLGAA